MKCFAPWHALSIRFNGDVVPDCVYTGRHGYLLKDDLPTILRNPGLISTQRIIATGEFPSNCLQCTAKESANGHSRRKFFEQVLNPMLKPESKGKNDIYFLEFNMSNVCNLKCRMCSGVNSTAWIKEDLKLDALGIQRPIHEPDFGYRNLSPDIVDRLFEYPEYSHSKRFQIAPDIVYYNKHEPDPLYDVIIGRNTLKHIKADLNFETCFITIDGVSLPMRNIANVQTKDAQLRILANSYHVEPVSTDQATKRAVKILDADYKAADLPKVVEENCPRVESELVLLSKIEEPFFQTQG